MKVSEKKDIRDFSLDELKAELKKANHPAYRANQLFYWIYKNNAHSFQDMKNLPKDLRDELERSYHIGSLKISRQVESKDKTKKFLFELQDKNHIETVIIPGLGRMTFCLSSQVGCRYACRFCASGAKGFVRNLLASEMTMQIEAAKSTAGCQPTNIVFMGMGEPLDNIDNLFRAIKIINGPDAIGIAARRITVSTCGIAPGIKRLKDLDIQINLSLSLHAANDRLRSLLMPVNKIFGLQEVIRSCEDYFKKTRRIITLEYILMGGINDSQKDSSELATIAKRLKAKVNIIAYSPVAGCGYSRPPAHKITEFIERLKQDSVNVTLRDSKGKDIDAACGQLAGKGTGI